MNNFFFFIDSLRYAESSDEIQGSRFSFLKTDCV